MWVETLDIYIYFVIRSIGDTSKDFGLDVGVITRQSLAKSGIIRTKYNLIIYIGYLINSLRNRFNKKQYGTPACIF